MGGLFFEHTILTSVLLISCTEMVYKSLQYQQMHSSTIMYFTPN